jgi:ATP-binding cassette subfamily B protein
VFKFKELLGLSAAGYRGFLRAVRACVLANLLLLLSFAVIIQAVIVLLEPLLNGAPVNIAKLWLLFGAGLAAVVLYALAYRNEYRKTYTASYSESEKIRLEVAEHIRRLPLSFFNNKDLSELTTNIMADCATIEHVMSHVLPGLCADIIAAVLACGALAFYDWRMALALFAALPLSLGLIWGVRQLMHSKLGERHVQAKLNVSDQMQEYLDGIKVVKAFGLAGEKSRALETALRSMMYEAIKGEGLSGAGITLASMILQAGLGLVTLIGVLLLTGGSLGIIKLLIFIIVSARIYSPLIVVMTLLTELFYWLISTRRMQALRREPLLTGAEDIVLPDYNI